jgi:6-phosphogluconolactonase
MREEQATREAVYVQTNDAEANEIVAFSRDADGGLATLGRFATGGRGTGTPHLPSQGSVTLTGDGRFLLVTNGGSGDVSTFRVEDDGLDLVGTTPVGDGPVSVAEHEGLVYVLLNDGDGAIAGFRLGDDGELAPLAGARRALSSSGADGAQVAFAPDGQRLVVSERATNRLSVFTIAADGTAGEAEPHDSVGATPYGFDFTPRGVLVVTEAFGGAVGKAAASSYGPDLEPISGSVGSGRSEVCWAAVTPDGRFAYVTNFGEGTISSYRIGADGVLTVADAVAATTVEGEKGVRDEALSVDGRFLYALDADAQRIFGFAIRSHGSLDPAGSTAGLPATAAGLAAS